MMEIKMKLVHMHPLTLIESTITGAAFPCPDQCCCSMNLAESNSCQCGGGAPCCVLCEEILSGSCYGCDTCWSQYPLVHQSCYEFQEEIQISYRPHCSLLFQNGSSDCDFCGRQDRKYNYCCGDCNFKVCFGCTSKLMKHHEGQQHDVEHFSHRHPLTLLKLDDMTCKLCNENIIDDGPAHHGCAPCKFYLHGSCRDQILPEIRYNFHPQHSLSLQDYILEKEKIKLCNACGSSMEGRLGYRCDTCDFHLHPKCMTSLKPNIKYQGHQHLLILVEDFSGVSGCEACGFDIKGVSFMRCLECDFDFHVQCDPLHHTLPPTVFNEEHEHPLYYIDKALTKDYDSPHLSCKVCEKKVNPEKPFYRCPVCNYSAHVRCAITEVEVQYNNDERNKLRHFSHHHILTFRYLHENEFIHCHGCRSSIQGSAYGCLDCQFYIHKSCAEMPRQVHHAAHHKHYLTLQVSDISHVCNTCDTALDGYFMYRCDLCKYNMDIGCASSHPSIKKLKLQTDESEKNHKIGERIGHFSHWHDLIMLEAVGRLSCKLCHDENINGQCYGCVQCNFYIHGSCGAVLQEIKHPFHPRHSLKLVVDEKPGYYWCSACCFSIKGLRYRCDECKFDLHPGCVSLKPNIEYKAHQQHLLILVENICFQQQCEACGLTTLDTSFMRCVECNINFHVKCGTNPQTPIILLKESGHHLTLLLQDKSHQWYCNFCKKERNQDHPAYYCADLDYYAHVHCVSEVVQIAETEEHVDEREKVEHFSHQHLLFPLENKRLNEDIIICCACEKNIQANPGYGCKSCKFYLHESCAKLPRKIQHPFHRHPLMLPSPCVGKYNQCSSCLKHYSGFSYQCHQGCSFNLDIDCSLLLPSLKLTSIHRHNLTFFKKMYDTPECQYCKIIPRNKITPLDSFYFRCVVCNFSRHLLCCPVPQTIEHDCHHHSLTLKDNFADLLDGFDDDEFCCDFCETRRDARESVYHCEECNFAVDIQCLFSQVMQFLKGNKIYIGGRIVSREMIKKIRVLTYKYVVESLTGEEKKSMEPFIEGIKKIEEGSLRDIFKELREISHLANERISMGLQNIDEDFFRTMARKVKQLESIDEGPVDVRGYKICRKLAPVLKNLLDRYGDIGAGCPYTQRLKTIPLTALCLIVQEMSDAQLIEIDDATIIFWWFHLKLVKKAGFRADFALDHVKKIVRFHFPTEGESHIKSSPFYGIHKEIAERSRRIDEERKEIEILENKAQEKVSAHDSGRPTLEAMRLNETLKLLPYKASLGLFDHDIRKL